MTVWLDEQERHTQNTRLLIASPDVVYDFMRTYAEQAYNVGFFSPNTNERLEELLLSRNDPMIDLALASFGVFEKTIKALYDKSRNSSYVDERIARGIRIACLSNRVFPKSDILERFPTTIPGNEEIRRIIHNDDGFEIGALLTNESLKRNFFSTLFTRKPPFDRLDAERWRSLLILASLNELVETSHSLVFTLLETAPIAPNWVWAIDRFLERLSPQHFNNPPLVKLEAVLTKWASSEADDANWKPTKRSDSLLGKDVNISPKEAFRCKIAAIFFEAPKGFVHNNGFMRTVFATFVAKLRRAALNDDRKATSAISSAGINSTDAACRSLWYSRAKLTVDDVNRALQADSEVFEISILYNDFALKNAKLRDVIEYSGSANNFNTRFQKRCKELGISQAQQKEHLALAQAKDVRRLEEKLTFIDEMVSMVFGMALVFAVYYVFGEDVDHYSSQRFGISRGIGWLAAMLCGWYGYFNVSKALRK